MNIKNNYYKIIDKIHSKFVIKSRETVNRKVYLMKYSSYRHSLKHNSIVVEPKENCNFFSARPNPGAGIGHQMANWIAGYWFARQFKLNFAHIPFSSTHIPYDSNKWDDFLGFGEDEITVEELCNNGYKKIRLPLFDEYNEQEVEEIKFIIRSYSDEKVVFIAEQDQFYHDQYGVMKDLQRKFYSASARTGEGLIYDNNNYNISIHVRRGDILQDTGKDNPNLTMRWQNNDYFVNALKNTLDRIKTDKSVSIYLFSQGKPKDYEEFKAFENVHYCLDMSAMDSFLHMVYADTIITSKSSFSYKPALLNRGLKICPTNFWHGYPDESSWILLDDTGMPLAK